MSFSELLKQCRKQKGISQAELASKLGVTQQAVGKWESGQILSRPRHGGRIAEILSTTADFLLGALPSGVQRDHPRGAFLRQLRREPHPGHRHREGRGTAHWPLRRTTGRSMPASRTPPITSTSSCAATAWSPAIPGR